VDLIDLDLWLALSFLLPGCAISLLLWAALHDLAARTVPNTLPAAICAIGIVVRLVDHTLLLGLAIAVAAFLLLFCIWRLGAVGGGDVKLWSASVLLIPPHWQMELSCLVRILLAGGILALVYLSLQRVVPRPRASHAGSLIVRVLRAEAWRIYRKAPLPYAFAIAGGTIVTLHPFPLAALR